ncbi:SIR2 family protein [Candidatus Spongiihabitans sp.]|uniref:SIR2 family protein n=1 Tax=Candidatus Spongiihabitans sp. TaxID=3101308 RepID=UPI003C7BB083
MTTVPELSVSIKLPVEICEAGLDSELVFFIGSGISKLAGYPSWGEFANKVLDELRKKKLIDFSEREQLAALDPRKKLSIARLIATNKEYDLDFSKHFIDESKNKDCAIYEAINDIGCICVTTNYDELLAPRFRENKDSPAVSSNRIYEREKFHEELLTKPGTVVHLHGSVSKPADMIVTMEEYLTHYSHDNIRDLLHALFKKHTVLFLGYGLEEAEILEHVLRRGAAQQRTDDRKIFILQGF